MPDLIDPERYPALAYLLESDGRKRVPMHRAAAQHYGWNPTASGDYYCFARDARTELEAMMERRVREAQQQAARRVQLVTEAHPITKNASPEFRGLWEECRKASEAVAKWPEWKRGELPGSVRSTDDSEEVDGGE